MDAYRKLIGQVVQEVAAEEGNSGIRLSKGSIGIYTSVDPQALHELVGQSITNVRQVEGQYLELGFSSGQAIRLPFSPEAKVGVESFCISVEGGPIVVG